MRIDFTKAMMKLDEMLWTASGQEGTSYAQLALTPMRDVLQLEMMFAERLYLSEKEWEDCHRQAAPIDSEMSIDADAVVSLGDDDGAYVQVWVYVNGSDARAAAQRLINARRK